jgi:hypothetical protein
MTAVAWPTGLPIVDNSVRVVGASQSGGRSIVAGAEQVVQSDAGYWVATALVRVRKPAEIVALRGLLAALDGRSFDVALPCCERARSPWGLTNPRLVSRPAPVVRSIAAIRDTTVDVTMPNNSLALAAGQRFSVAQHMYEVRSATQVSGAHWTVVVRPPLRATLAVNDVMEFEQPICAMRLARDDTAEIQLTQNRFDQVSIEFEESLA